MSEGSEEPGMDFKPGVAWPSMYLSKVSLAEVGRRA